MSEFILQKSYQILSPPIIDEIIARAIARAKKTGKFSNIPNAYIIYRMAFCKSISKHQPKISLSDKSRLSRDSWKKESDEVKKSFEQRARDAKESFNRWYQNFLWDSIPRDQASKKNRRNLHKSKDEKANLELEIFETLSDTSKEEMENPSLHVDFKNQPNVFNINTEDNIPFSHFEDQVSNTSIDTYTDNLEGHHNQDIFFYLESNCDYIQQELYPGNTFLFQDDANLGFNYEENFNDGNYEYISLSHNLPEFTPTPAYVNNFASTNIDTGEITDFINFSNNFIYLYE
ncbi:hypothetical protein G9A89_004499 [Geosiphon pyriformis]|nr:hypothetical protein G9A89_004499 [Geosiphon pyriformis]